MKSILLATASIVAFAGVAAAEVSFSGNATLGYNDTDALDEDGLPGSDDLGFYWEVELNPTLSVELDNGLTAAATFETEFADSSEGDASDGDLGNDIVSSDFVLSLKSETSGLYFGDTQTAATDAWDNGFGAGSAKGAAGDMLHDNFSETDGETVIKGMTEFAGFKAAVSYFVDNADDTAPEGGNSLDQLSLGATGEIGMVGMTMAYQSDESDFVNAPGNDDYNDDELFGISGRAGFAGADVKLAYARNMTLEESSTGISAAYPVGPVTLNGYYVLESADGVEDSYGVGASYSSGAIDVAAGYEEVRGTEDWQIEGNYDFGMGLMAFAGVSDAGEDYYFGTQYILGATEGGAESKLTVSYAEDGDRDAEDEIGTNDYKEGTTVEVSFQF